MKIKKYVFKSKIVYIETIVTVAIYWILTTGFLIQLYNITPRTHFYNLIFLCSIVYTTLLNMRTTSQIFYIMSKYKSFEDTFNTLIILQMREKK